MTDDRTKSLIIAYKCSSCKRTCYNTSFKYHVPIEDFYWNWAQQKWEETNSAETIQTETQNSERWIR